MYTYMYITVIYQKLQFSIQSTISSWHPPYDDDDVVFVLFPDPQEPYAVVVLLESDLVVVDLTSQG